MTTTAAEPARALALLGTLSGLYSAAAGLKNIAYDRGWANGRRLRWPVISVGNLSVGGAGKTPVVIRLAELLAAQGVHVSILSRGYGRRSDTIEVVDPGGIADRFGDEPLLIARHLAAAEAGNTAQVVVGADRHAAGVLAEALAAQRHRPGPLEPGSGQAQPRKLASHEAPLHYAQPSVHILDDGFQHRRLARDLDVVVLHRSDFYDRLLPAGRLREGLGSLRRASVIVLREEDAALELHLRQSGVNAPVWFVRRSVLVPDGSQRVVTFCGIARPAEFFAAVRGTIKNVLTERAFPDHYRYSIDDMDTLRRLAVDFRADGFITTEKDAVRFGPELMERLCLGCPPLPLGVAQLSVSFRDEHLVIATLLRVVGA